MTSTHLMPIALLPYHYLSPPTVTIQKVPRHCQISPSLQNIPLLRITALYERNPGRRINIYWRRQWHPTPVLLPGKSHGWRSLGGYSPWGHKELDTKRISQILKMWMTLMSGYQIFLQDNFKFVCLVQWKRGLNNVSDHWQ